MGHERKRETRGSQCGLAQQRTRQVLTHCWKCRDLLGTKYVITLDTDTFLPRDAARQLIGTLAHILNRAAQIHETHRVVTEGYGSLQPGIAIKLDKGGQSWFVRLYGGDPGVDPYTRAISDVYQDVFHEGSFIGKGTMTSMFSPQRWSTDSRTIRS